MRKLASLTMAGAMALAAAGLATSANATNFVGTDTVTGYTGSNSDFGLHIQISNPTGLNFDLLNVGDSTGYIDLFTIYTDEATYQGDDGINRNLNLAFNFSAPAPGANGGLGGETDGSFGGILVFGFPLGGHGASGQLGWDNTETLLNFGSGYQLRVNLESNSETFNAGSTSNNFNPGLANGANVRANFTLMAAPAGGAVPEPATWGMMIMGFGLAGATLRRRRTAATFA